MLLLLLADDAAVAVAGCCCCCCFVCRSLGHGIMAVYTTHASVNDDSRTLTPDPDCGNSWTGLSLLMLAALVLFVLFA